MTAETDYQQTSNDVKLMNEEMEYIGPGREEVGYV